MEVSLQFDDTKLIAYLKGLKDSLDRPEIQQAMIDAAVILEAGVKAELNELVYKRQESPKYKRTRKLFNATMASGYEVRIIGDEVQVTGEPKTEKEGDSVLTSGVTSHARYGLSVHDGLGMNSKIGPRPFMTRGYTRQEKKINQVIKNAVKKLFNDDNKPLLG